MMEQHELIIPSGARREITLIHNTPESAKRIIRLAGEGAQVEVDEVFVSGGVQSELVIIHEAKATVSKVRSRGVIDKNQLIKAHARVQIPKGVINCDTHVAQEFLLLEESGKVDALPALEIEEQDVRAGHKAAIAPLDENTLFYLTARGMSEEEAKKLLIRGFLRIPESFAHVVGKWQ